MMPRACSVSRLASRAAAFCSRIQELVNIVVKTASPIDVDCGGISIVLVYNALESSVFCLYQEVRLLKTWNNSLKDVNFYLG